MKQNQNTVIPSPDVNVHRAQNFHHPAENENGSFVMAKISVLTFRFVRTVVTSGSFVVIIVVTCKQLSIECEKFT